MHGLLLAFFKLAAARVAEGHSGLCVDSSRNIEHEADDSHTVLPSGKFLQARRRSVVGDCVSAAQRR